MTGSRRTIAHTGLVRLLAVAALLAGALGLLAGASSAPAAKQKTWVETGNSPVPLEYFQGVTSDRRGHFYFDGVFTGLYRTDLNLVEQARSEFNVIPPDVGQREGYNHIGDLTWDHREHGRLLLPLECFFPFIGNFCKTGSIGVADPDTLTWRYYVKLDPAYIDKVMFGEVSPNGRLYWTSNGGLNGGHDLLAYDVSQITAANAAPGGPLLKPVKILPNAVPPSGITGAVFFKNRLLVAGANGTNFQVWSIDLRDGSRTLVISKQVLGESEGLDIRKALGGKLHWLITPQGTGGQPPTYGDFGHSALVHFAVEHGGPKNGDD